MPGIFYQRNTIARALLVLQQQGIVVSRDLSPVDVEFARHHLQFQSLGVTDQGSDDAVYVRQLVARGVDRVVVGIPDESPVGGSNGIQCPRGNHRQPRVRLLRTVGLVKHVGLRPAVIAFLFCDRVGLGVVLQVPVLQIFAWLEECALPTVVVGKGEDRGGIRIRKPDAQGSVVNLLELRELASRRPLCGFGRCKLIVQDLVLPPEEYVLKGKRRAVGPLEALPEVKGDSLAVCRELVTLGQVGQHLGGIRTVSQQSGPASIGEIRPPGKADRTHTHAAAVLAYLLHRNQHQRLFGKPLFHWRDLSGGDPGLQLRRFLVAGYLVAGGFREVGRRGIHEIPRLESSVGPLVTRCR